MLDGIAGGYAIRQTTVQTARHRSMMSQLFTWHPEWQAGQALIAAAGGADRRSAKNADRPINQSREAHLAARLPHSPERGSF
jgi:hypothetical protein